MIIIPVIDLLQGEAVQAHLGQRETYRPLDSPLCRNGDVTTLVDRLTDGFGCSLIYFADLDAIQGTGDNTGLLTRIAADFPGLDIWLDGGFRTPADVSRIRQRLAMRTVIGSESWMHAGALPDEGPILSIDMDGEDLRDPSGICNDPLRRPMDAILMTLDRVGSQQGPDFRTLEHWQAEAPDTRFYAAGGVRNRNDLCQLQTAGAAGVLLASALHHGNLSPDDLADLS